jgi:hypothetical protein
MLHGPREHDFGGSMDITNARLRPCVFIIMLTSVVMVTTATDIRGLAQSSTAAKNEDAAIRALRATKGAQASYSAACGHGGVAISYLVLGTPPNGAPEAFITKELGSSESPKKDGYVFHLVAPVGAVSKGADCRGTAAFSDDSATAVPEKFGTTGSRSFAMKSDGVIWQTLTATPPKEPFGPPATKVEK